MATREQEIDGFLTRGVAEVIGLDHLKKRLLAKDKLRVKFGIDPTSPNIHLGRAVPLLKLRDLQNLGCEVYFIVGDFTGQIGDTSDKESERPMLSEALVQENLKTYLDQAYKILNKETTKVFYNSKWLSELSLRRLGNLATWFSLHDFISRENIKRRLDEGKRISLRELFYPLMQGYDSVMVDADLEIGGTDQRFNILAGREAQRHLNDFISPEHNDLIRENIGCAPKQRSGNSIGPNPSAEEPQDIVMTGLILGTDGRKMSSSWGNTINLFDAPNDMFGKIMSIPDELIMEYFVHCTRVPMEAVAKIAEEIVTGGNPRDAKVRLGKEIVAIYYGVEAAAQAEHYFIETFTKKHIPDDIPEFSPQYEPALEGYENIESFIARVGLATSKSDARRKIEQGGVSLGDERVVVGSRMFNKVMDNGKVMKVGKKDFVKIIFS